MKAFYGLMLEEQKEDRTYQFNAPLGAKFDEVKEVLDIFKSMIEEMAKNALEKENQDKQLNEEASVSLETSVNEVKEDDGSTS